MNVLTIGAGIAGLTAARRLQENGHTVTVLDKGRAPGGHMATRRVLNGDADRPELAELAFDHGAQYFTARDARFAHEVEGWHKARGPPESNRTIALGDLPAALMPRPVRLRTLAPTPGLMPGMAVRLRASLQAPPGPAMPGGYDFARTAWFSELGAVGFAVGAVVVVPDPPEPPLGLRWRAPVERVRQWIGARITAALPGETGAIATALVTGERGGISERTNDAFRDSGLLHILSISGLHMSIMAGAVFVTMRLLLAAFPSVALRYPIKKWAATGAAVGALGYLLISGASYATVRSYITITVMLAAVLLDRPAIALRNVALSALVILAIWPESLLDVGFQMSYAAVVALVTAFELIRLRAGRDGRRGPGPLLAVLLLLAGIVLSTVIASLSVAPFAAFHFHKSQQYAVIANLIAIPICNVLVMPAALATLLAMPLGLEWAPLAVMGRGIDVMVWCATTVAALPGAIGRIPAIPSAAFGLMVAGGIWLLLWRSRWRLAGLVPIALGLAIAPTGALPDVLVSGDGRLVAVRGGDGRLAAIGGRGSAFDLSRWLEHDGDGRAPAAALAAGRERLACNAELCLAAVKGHAVAIVSHRRAMAEACAKAHIVVTSERWREACPSAVLLLDRTRLERSGPHAVTIAPGAIKAITVAEARGTRPWRVDTPEPDDRPGRRWR